MTLSQPQMQLLSSFFRRLIDAENFNGIDRKRLFKHIQTLEMNDIEFKEATKALESLYKLLTK